MLRSNFYCKIIRIIINITTNNTQQQQASGGTKVIERVVEKPAAKPAEPAELSLC